MRCLSVIYKGAKSGALTTAFRAGTAFRSAAEVAARLAVSVERRFVAETLFRSAATFRSVGVEAVATAFAFGTVELARADRSFFVVEFFADAATAFAERLERLFGDDSAFVVALKGAGTVVADGNGAVCVNETGNPNLATGGSGDVLTGVIVGLLAQGATPLDAARSAVALHGLAADLKATRCSRWRGSGRPVK